MTSKSFNPTDVKWIPPVHALTPRYPTREAEEEEEEGNDDVVDVPKPGRVEVDPPVGIPPLVRRKADGMFQCAVSPPFLANLLALSFREFL